MEEIGRRLQAARIAKGLTLEEVEEETRIRKKYIEALESGRTSVIPGEVYVKGFLRTYGNFLGLDGEALVEEYKAKKRAPAEEGERGSGGAGRRRAEAPRRRGTDASGDRAEAAARGRGENAADAAPADQEVAPAVPEGARITQAPRPPAFVQPPRRSSRNRRRHHGPGPGVYLMRRILVALVVLLPLAGLGYWLWNRSAAVPQAPPDQTAVQAPGPSQQAPETGQEPAQEPVQPPEREPEAGETPQPAVTVGKPNGQDVDVTVSAETIDLEMHFSARTWVEVSDAAGTILYSGIADGTTLSYHGDGFQVRLGHVNSFSLTINGEPVDYGLEGGPYTLHIKKSG